MTAQRALLRICADLRQLDGGLAQLCATLPEHELRGTLECVRTDLLEDATATLKVAARRGEAEWRWRRQQLQTLRAADLQEPRDDAPLTATQRALLRIYTELRELDGRLAQLCATLPQATATFNAQAELRGTLECVRTDLLEDAMVTLKAVQLQAGRRQCQP